VFLQASHSGLGQETDHHGRDEELTTHDPPVRQALTSNLQSAFASNSKLRCIANDQMLFSCRPTIAGLDKRPAHGRDEDLAPHDPPGRQVLPSNLQSAFAGSSNLRFSDDQGRRPPLSGRRSHDAEGGRSSMDSVAAQLRTRTSPEELNR